jgi:structural maintenance of chromosome 2
VTKQKEVITAQDNVIKDKYAEVAKYKEQNNDSQLKIKELDHNISKHKREAEDAAAKACLCSFLPLIIHFLYLGC